MSCTSFTDSIILREAKFAFVSVPLPHRVPTGKDNIPYTPASSEDILNSLTSKTCQMLKESDMLIQFEHYIMFT